MNKSVLGYVQAFIIKSSIHDRLEHKIGKKSPNKRCTSDTEFVNENINTRRTNQNNSNTRSPFALLRDLYSEVFP